MTKHRVRSIRAFEDYHGFSPGEGYHTYTIGKMVDEMNRRGVDVIDLVGNEVKENPPPCVNEAVKAALDSGQAGYAPLQGLPELREAISEKLRNLDHVDVDPDREILVTQGAEEGLFLAVETLIDEGDEVLMTAPEYPFDWHISYSGGTPVYVPLSEADNYRLIAEEFSKRISPETRMICLSNPHNPTGRVFTKDELQGIADLAQDHDLYILSDVANERLVWDDRAFINVVELSNRRNRDIITGSVSKSYGMGGWRIGYVAASEDLISKMMKLHLIVTNTVNIFAQKGAAALYNEKTEYFTELVRCCEERRNSALDQINQILNLRCHKPEGGAVLLPHVGGFSGSSLELAKFLLEKTKVGVAPGSGYLAEGRIRMNFTSPRIQEALERIKTGMTYIH